MVPKYPLGLCSRPTGDLFFALVPLYIAVGFGLRHENVDENPLSMNLLSLLCIFSIIAAVLVPGTSAFFFVSDKILLLLLVTRKDIDILI